MPFPFIAVGAAIAGGIFNAISGASQAKQANERVRRAQALAAEGLIDSGQLSERLRAIDRMFNQRLISTLNTTALRNRGVANRGVVGAAVAGGIEGDRLAAQEGVISNTQSINTGIRQNISQLALGGQSNDVAGNLISGGLGGLQVGLQAERLINRPEIEIPGQEAGGALGSNLPQVGGDPTSFFKPGTGGINNLPSLDDEDLFGFQQPTALQRIFRGF